MQPYSGLPPHQTDWFVCSTDYLTTEKVVNDFRLKLKHHQASNQQKKTLSYMFYSVSWQWHVPIGQLSYTCLAMSAAESFGENRNSFVFPLTRMSLKLICNTNITKDHKNLLQNPCYTSPKLAFSSHCMFSFINEIFFFTSVLMSGIYSRMEPKMYAKLLKQCQIFGYRQEHVDSATTKLHKA